MNASRVLGPSLSSSINPPTILITSSSFFLLCSSSKPSPILSTSSPTSSFFPSPNKIASLRRSDSNVICFQRSGATEDKSVLEGTVTESLSNGSYAVTLDNGNMIVGHVSGRIRQRAIQILPGDRVRIEMSRYDSTKGRITYRTTKTVGTDIPKKPGKTGPKR